MVPRNERFELRLEADLINKIDSWRARQNDMPSRSEAVRSLVEAGLTREEILSPGQSFIVCMLCEIYKHLKIKGDMDPELISSAILSGQLWSLEWEYEGVFQDYVASRSKVSEVVDILDMFSFIESSYGKLSPEDQQYVKEQNEYAGIWLVFDGFDGNNESDYYGIANFLIKDMGRFSEFKSRRLNSHRPVLVRYRKMLSVFDSIRHRLTGAMLSKEQIVEVITAPFIKN